MPFNNLLCNYSYEIFLLILYIDQRFAKDIGVFVSKAGPGDGLLRGIAQLLDSRV
jgi:hypothetical protein